MEFLKFLALIGITNLIVGYGWFIPAILIALPLQIINKSFAFIVQRLLGVALMCLVMVNIAYTLSIDNSIYVYLIYLFLGFILNFYSIIQSMQSMRDHSRKNSFDFNYMHETETNIRLDTAVSLPFCILFYIIVSIFPNLSQNEVIYLIMDLIYILIDLPVLGEIILVSGGLTGIFLIPYALFQIFFMYIVIKSDLNQ